MNILIYISDVTSDQNAMGEFQKKLEQLMKNSFKYIIGIALALVAIWAAYIGIKFIVAKKAEQQVEAKQMLKQFIIGCFLIFVLAVGVPLLIQTLMAWYEGAI